MARALPSGAVTIVEPNEVTLENYGSFSATGVGRRRKGCLQTHYYQPGFTLVAAGLMSVAGNAARQVRRTSEWFFKERRECTGDANSRRSDSAGRQGPALPAGKQRSRTQVSFPSALKALCSTYVDLYY